MGDSELFSEVYEAVILGYVSLKNVRAWPQHSFKSEKLENKEKLGLSCAQLKLVLGQKQHLSLCGNCFKKKGKKSFAQFCSRSEQQETLFSQTFKSAK